MRSSNSILVSNIINGIKNRTTNSQAVLKAVSFQLSPSNITSLKTVEDILILMPVTVYTAFSEINLFFDKPIENNAKGELSIFYLSSPDESSFTPIYDGLLSINAGENGKMSTDVLQNVQDDTEGTIERYYGKTIGDYLCNTVIPRGPLFLGCTTIEPIDEKITSGYFNAMFTNEEGYVG